MPEYYMAEVRRSSAFFIFAVIAAVWCSSSAAALPGFTPYISDVSGEYVYYEDKTFDRTSYIGFLYYNDSTYAVRYYAPEDRDRKLPSRAVEILFSLDPSADHIELTGERIIGSMTPDDTELINYIHDIFYELNSRRIKAGAVSPSAVNTDKSVTDDFPQFGGNVAMDYDYIIPLFNLKKITSGDGSVLLQIVTTGTLYSSDDESFTSFSGVPEKYFDRNHVFSKDEKARSKTFATPDGQAIVLDSQWTQPMDNLWMLGDTAIVSAAVIPKPDGAGDNAASVVLRKMLRSTKDSYISWRDISLEYDGNRYVINCVFFQPDSGTVTRTFRILTDRNDGGYYFFTLSVFNNIYQTNHSYFDSIIGGYTVMQRGGGHE
ncbi:MAG TPA: hypothetical protein DCL73_15420 [Treponema sp.]|nr:hypothetical protein [Treponema sp.]